MPHKLPPLNSLRFFEAAARLGSYRLVAEELHVTASAVSHSMLTLEAWFGAKLFDRAPQGLKPTELGLALLPVIAVFVRRTLFEDAMLHRELTGYPQYAARVRWRVVPGVF